nr:hypothetical protein [Candidatus Sigynarchaeota archaeon]
MTRKKGYIFLEVGGAEDPKKISSRIQEKFLEKKKDYSCTVVGKYNIVVEKFIDELTEIKDLLAKIRDDEKIKPLIIKATTFIGIQQGKEASN